MHTHLCRRACTNHTHTHTNARNAQKIKKITEKKQERFLKKGSHIQGIYHPNTKFQKENGRERASVGWDPRHPHGNAMTRKFPGLESVSTSLNSLYIQLNKGQKARVKADCEISTIRRRY